MQRVRKESKMDYVIKLHLQEIKELKKQFQEAQNEIERSKIMTLINVMSLSVVNHLIEKTQQKQELKKAA
jgi:hypothetical protein